jgi:hypothetical protein
MHRTFLAVTAALTMFVVTASACCGEISVIASGRVVYTGATRELARTSTPSRSD